MSLDVAHAGRFAIYVVWAYGISGAVLAAVTIESVARAWRWKRRAGKAPARTGTARDGDA